LNMNFSMEIDLLVEVFSYTGEQSLTSVSIDQFILSLPQRLAFWKKVALIPSIGKTVYIADNKDEINNLIHFSFSDGKLIQGFSSEFITYMTFIDSLNPENSYNSLDSPLFLRGDNIEEPFLVIQSGDITILILLESKNVFGQLVEKIKKNVFPKGAQPAKGWEIKLKIVENNKINQFEKEYNMYVYPLSSVYKIYEYGIYMPPSFGQIPEFLKGSEKLDTILNFRQDDSYWEGMENSLLKDGYGLWSFLHLDRDKLTFEAFKQEMGWIFIIYTVLAMLIALFIMLFNYSRRAKKQIQEQMRFIANVSHELRTPLGVICNAGANIKDGYVKDPVRFRQYGELIFSQGKRLTRMVESVLLYSGMLAGKNNKEFIDIDDFVLSLILPIEFICTEKGIRFEKQIETGLLVYCDREGLYSALLNLLYNGIIHGGSGRFLRLVIGEDVKKNGIFFSVRDLGPGISEEERKKIYTPFFRGLETVRTALPGSGIGLSLVSRVAEIHSGYIKLESQHNKGSLFTLYIPSKEEQEK